MPVLTFSLSRIIETVAVAEWQSVTACALKSELVKRTVLLQDGLLKAMSKSLNVWHLIREFHEKLIFANVYSFALKL